MKKFFVIGVVVGVAVVVAIMAGSVVPKASQPQTTGSALEKGGGGLMAGLPADGRTAAAGGAVPDAQQPQDDETSSNDDSESEPAEPQTEEERREAAEEKLVDAFDDLTDKWMEHSPKGVTMADVDSFVKSFQRLPKARQDECVHRALNLIPDENVMLLAGILMDKEMDKEIVETVYNDILNRDEDVKKPILRQIFKDKTHPCWTDTAWILDVTGDLPGKK